ncbi:Ig-like domain-containing protein [Verminephrobacter aporrectodeae]|uniref:Ig-like domain-containing protein n=1 Tax=Verminephrobacter aporrectodeae TaxID=1110389 RepID=UPI0039088A90
MNWPTASADRTVWTATFTPTANVSTRENTIRVNLAGVSDAGTGRCIAVCAGTSCGGAIQCKYNYK